MRGAEVFVSTVPVFRARYVVIDGILQPQVDIFESANQGFVRHPNGTVTTIVDRAPLGWWVLDRARNGVHIPLDGEPVVNEPFPHQPEWALTAEDALGKLHRQTVQRRTNALREAARQFALVEQMRAAPYFSPSKGS